MLFLIANTNSVGGFEKLAPDASIDDGLFDVIAVKKCNLAEFIRLVTLAIRGEHLQDKKVVYFRTDAMEVTSPGYVQLNLDGELGGTLPEIPDPAAAFADFCAEALRQLDERKCRWL